MAYTEEEQYWSQRSRILWLNAGDRNFRFFHAVTRGRRAQNKFLVLEDSSGNAVFSESQIVNTMADFYRNIFSTESSCDLAIVNEVLFPKVTEEMNSMLISIPEPDEIHAAVFAINADKAPGPDGFLAGFYQPFWDIIGEDVTREIQEFFISGSLHQRQNETHLRLIPKIKGPKQVSDYRPIRSATHIIKS